jgi:hypothetical protein
MSDAAATPPLPVRRLLLPLLCGLLLALAMVRMPVPMDVDPLTAHRAGLYESFRRGLDWAGLATPEGPLTALQTPVYLSGSLWMAVTWQLAGNLLLAGLLVAAAWRLPWSQRTWALACLAGVLARWPELAPWLGIVVLGHELIRAWDREPVAVLPRAVILGFLALFSAGHLLLAAAAIGFTVLTARPPLAKLLAAAGLLLGVAGGWLLLGQSLPGLALWLGRELPALWTTSAALRLVDVTPFAPWAFVCALGLATVLVRFHGAGPARQRSLPGGLFLAVAGWLAWKTIALQAYGQPLVFFGTIMLAGFILWHHGCRTCWAAALLVLGLAGLARGHPDFLPGALGHFNRQMVFNYRQFASGTQFRTDLRASVSSLRSAHASPKLPAIIGRATVGADADALPRALLNNLAVVFPASARTGPGAPEFVVQRLSASVGQPAAFADAPAQLALYRNYELQTQESGVLLWHRKSAATPAPVQVATGTLAFGEPLKLPAAADTAYWLELDLQPGILGRAWSVLDELTAPGLIVRHEVAGAVRYALPPAVAARGFLIDPLVRGNVEFQRWQRGEHPPRVTEVTVVVPPAGAWLWPARFTYRLYAVTGLKLAGDALRPAPEVSFRTFSRSPVGSAYTIPFIESATDNPDALCFVHPGSLLEFAVHGTDRRIRGSFGIAAGAYGRPGQTDGVDFSIEFLGLDGRRRVLLHRYLNPGVEAADRAVQEFDLVLPDATDGRLLLRTFNPPWRSGAWDWAFWQNVIIE